VVSDRRATYRYPLGAEVRYQIINQRRPSAGTGRTVDLSSRGALIQTADLLPNGAKIKLSMVWPVRLNGRIALSLEVVGRIVRVDGCLAGVVFDHHEFRTRGMRHEAAQEPPEARGGAVTDS